nr:uncharacterized protein LOC112489440 isoform X3 [Ziziphus jujuba var. spinosa]
MDSYSSASVGGGFRPSTQRSYLLKQQPNALVKFFAFQYMLSAVLGLAGVATLSLMSLPISSTKRPIALYFKIYESIAKLSNSCSSLPLL